MVTDRMIAGLYDKDIQAEVLSKESELKTFKQKYDRVVAMEEASKTRQALHQPQSTSSVAAASSSYKRNKREDLKSKSSPSPSGCPRIKPSRKSSQP